MKIVETVAFDYMMRKDSQTTNKYLLVSYVYVQHQIRDIFKSKGCF